MWNRKNIINHPTSWDLGGDFWTLMFPWAGWDWRLRRLRVTSCVSWNSSDISRATNNRFQTSLQTVPCIETVKVQHIGCFKPRHPRELSTWKSLMTRVATCCWQASVLNQNLLTCLDILQAEVEGYRAKQSDPHTQRPTRPDIGL
jgi:hypothetical protein